MKERKHSDVCAHSRLTRAVSGAVSLTKVNICGPETRAALEAYGALRDNGGITARSHQVMDLVKDLGDKE